MSLTLETYAISFPRLRQVAGSADRRLADAVAAECAYLLEQADGLRDEPGDGPTCRQALDQIIDGGPLDEDYGYLYGYALEAICAHLGRELPNVSAISRAARWVEEVDRFLEGRGVPLSLTDLVYAGCPVEIPELADSPYIGSWSPAVVAAGLEALGGLDLGGVDREMAEMVAQIRGWLEAAAAIPDGGIVGFLC